MLEHCGRARSFTQHSVLHCLVWFYWIYFEVHYITVHNIYLSPLSPYFNVDCVQMSCCLHEQDGGYVIVLSVCLSVNLWADHWKSNEPISLKLAVMIGSTNRQNWLTSCWAPVADTDSGSLFHFPLCCQLLAFLIVTGWFSRHLAK